MMNIMKLVHETRHPPL